MYSALMNEPNPIEHHESRVTRLEEALGFTSYEMDQLKEHFLALTRAVEGLEPRVARIEQALQDSKRPVDGNSDTREDQI
jgi:hypothetical protein